MIEKLRERPGARSREPSRSERLHEQLSRYSPELLELDRRLREGWFTDRYFLRTAGTLVRDGRDPDVTMQLFAKKSGRVAGIAESIRILQAAIATRYTTEAIRVRTLLEGDEIRPWEPVMHISGPFRAFAHLETSILGVLARRSLVASNTAKAVEAAGDKPVVFMGARHDDWRVQAGDGFAALLGGAAAVSTDAGGHWWGAEGVGTMPHALIAAYGGDTVAATLAFYRYIRDVEPNVRVVSLVDYQNDVIETSLAVARAMWREHGPGALHALRVDTSESMVDRSLREDPDHAGRREAKGVNPHLVRKLRAALDETGFSRVGVLVSGGVTPAKIADFESERVPVDGYGVGSSLLGHDDGGETLETGFDFTADIVVVNGSPEAKAGRAYTDSRRLVDVDWRKIQ